MILRLPVMRTCEHQKASLMPCPWPSCPSGHLGEKFKLVTTKEVNGQMVKRFMHLRRRFRNGRFEWVPIGSSARE